MRVVIRRLLGEKIVAVGVLGSGKKDDAMWHVPHFHTKCLEMITLTNWANFIFIRNASFSLAKTFFF